MNRRRSSRNTLRALAALDYPNYEVLVSRQQYAGGKNLATD